MLRWHLVWTASSTDFQTSCWAQDSGQKVQSYWDDETVPAARLLPSWLGPTDSRPLLSFLSYPLADLRPGRSPLSSVFSKPPNGRCATIVRSATIGFTGCSLAKPVHPRPFKPRLHYQLVWRFGPPRCRWGSPLPGTRAYFICSRRFSRYSKLLFTIGVQGLSIGPTRCSGTLCSTPSG